MLLMARHDDNIDQLDILICSVRLTKDGVPICTNESVTDSDELHVRNRTLSELVARIGQVTTLTELLDKHFGNVLLSLQLKGVGTARVVTRLLKDTYISSDDDWTMCLLSSFKLKELYRARRAAPKVPLALLQRKNPFVFTAHYRPLKLSAVGFHRLYTSSLALNIARRTGIFRFIYTVNRPTAITRFSTHHFDAVATDMPEKFQQLCEEY